jgi:hypothetical protein
MKHTKLSMGLAAGLSLAAQSASAQTNNTAGDPPPAAEAFTLNVKAGVSALLAPIVAGAMGSVIIEPGLPVLHNGRGHLILPIEIAPLVGAVFVTVSAGFQYDVPLPVARLSLTSRVGLGCRLIMADEQTASGPAITTTALGYFDPALGIKYVTKKHMNLGLDFLDMPISFRYETLVEYRALAYVGFNI